VRSRLWASETQIERSELPSTGLIMEALTKGKVNAAELDAAYPERLRQTIY
jgi:hypothetical protein